MTSCYLSLGSNLGNKIENINRAVSLIYSLIGNISEQSAIYHSEPWGKLDQASFVNKVILVKTTLSPYQVLEAIKKIESELGRIRHTKWGNRSIDIDILFYNDQIVDEPSLIIPHPLMSSRNFVLKPLFEIAPQFIHPVFSKTIKELYLESKDHSLVTELDSNN